MTLLDQATPLCDSDDVNPPLCERCNKPFTARSGSGGKPQCFCSSECRTASHTDSQRSDSQRQDDQQNVGKTPALVTLGSPPKQYDFDWSGEDVIIHEQPATAVYFNPQGALVIRQRASDYDYHDPFVYIGPDHIEAFLDKLCDVCGIPSVGRRT
jgi:hypothetical protein